MLKLVVIFGLTMFARQQLAPLDLEELQKARYEYKGRLSFGLSLVVIDLALSITRMGLIHLNMQCNSIKASESHRPALDRLFRTQTPITQMNVGVSLLNSLLKSENRIIHQQPVNTPEKIQDTNRSSTHRVVGVIRYQHEPSFLDRRYQRRNEI